MSQIFIFHGLEAKQPAKHKSSFIFFIIQTTVMDVNGYLATVKKIKEFGYNAEIIRYKKKLTPTFVMQSIPRLFNVSFVKSKLAAKDRDRRIAQHLEIAKMVSVRNHRFQMFVTDHFANLSREFEAA